MSEQQPMNDLKAESSRKGKDPKTRKLLMVMVALWLLTLCALIGIAWGAYFNEKDKTQTLSQQVIQACAAGIFGPDFSVEDEKALCSNAREVVKDDPELQENEIQELEDQEAEIQDSEIDDPDPNDPEKQDAEIQDPELTDEELQEAEIQDEEIQEAEEQEGEVQDDEIQDPEVDDPDLASPYEFRFRYIVPGNGIEGDRTYLVTCNSGTGECTTTEEGPANAQ